MRWDDTTIAAVRECAAKGMSGAKIADAISKHAGETVGRNAILGLCYRQEIPLIGKGSKAYRITHTRQANEPRNRRTVQRTSFRGFRVEQRTVNQPEELPPTPIADHEIPHEQRRTLMQLTADTCRWPVGEPGTPEFFFCGAVPAKGWPYCRGHCRVAYQPSKSERRAAA